MSTQENLTKFCFCIEPADMSDKDRVLANGQKAALLNAAMWSKGTTITVGFMEGSHALQDRVSDVANEWITRTGISLSFDFRRKADNTDIRIAFKQGNGSWSYLGTVCRSIAPNLPTMNYGWLTDQSDDATIRSVVLHEFGHALGLIHEHQNPKKPIKWNRDNVISDLSGPPNNWDLAKIENNMFKRYEPNSVTATDLDESSIMLYPVPKRWTMDDFSSSMNGDLSAVDIDLIKSVYK